MFSRQSYSSPGQTSRARKYQLRSKRMKCNGILIAHRGGARRRCELAILPPCAKLLIVGFTDAQSALRPEKERSREARRDVKHSAGNHPSYADGPRCQIPRFRGV
jgi:hypothetical protein